MQENNFKSLLKKYEQKRNNAEKKLENNKLELYKENPKLQEINDALNKLYLKKSKNILLNISDDSLENKINYLQKEKNNLLSTLKINKDFFSPEYECSLCNDTGYITNTDGTSSMCSCLKQELININFNKSNIGNLEKENFEKFNINIFSDEINFNKYNSKISPRENMQNIKNLALKFIENFDNPDEKNLLFTGNTGLRENFFI